MLIMQNRIKAVKALLKKDNREFFQGLREGGEDLEGISDTEIESTIARIESESW